MAAVSLSACSNDDAPPSPQAPTSSVDSTASAKPSTAVIDPADIALAESARLELSDFPAGWKAVPEDDDDDESREEEREAIARCVGVDPNLLDINSLASAETPAFTNEDDEEVEEKIFIAASMDDAVERYDIIASAKYRDCLAEAAADVDELQDQDDTEVSQPTVSEISLGSFGDQSTAFRIEVTLTQGDSTLDIVVDFVFIRVGRVMVQMAASRLAPIGSLTTDEFAGYVEKAMSRVEEKAANA